MFGQRYRNCVKAEEGKDPQRGQEKNQGSGRRLPSLMKIKNTVSVKFIQFKISRHFVKASFKSKSHKRQSQIINLTPKDLERLIKTQKILK